MYLRAYFSAPVEDGTLDHHPKTMVAVVDVAVIAVVGHGETALVGGLGPGLPPPLGPVRLKMNSSGEESAFWRGEMQKEQTKIKQNGETASDENDEEGERRRR